MTLTVDAVTPESRAVGHEAQRRRSSVRGEKKEMEAGGEEEKGFLGYSGISYRLPAAASRGKIVYGVARQAGELFREAGKFGVLFR